MSRGLWIWNDSIKTIAFDSAAARRTLAAAKRDGRLAKIDILVPATSQSRRQLALVIQESWRRLGVDATITVVDFPIFQERIAAGRFDSYIGVYLDEPSPRGLADQWSRRGWDALNYGRYANPRFDSLLARASQERDVPSAQQLWREAMDTLNADAPAVFLYTLTNTAAFHRRLANITIDPYSWASTLPTWTVDSAYARH
jgi:peptide/nickel transport system substrate-binding protein